jgi:hypothetical protein
MGDWLGTLLLVLKPVPEACYPARLLQRAPLSHLAVAGEQSLPSESVTDRLQVTSLHSLLHNKNGQTC